jgi:hypothetical protein
MVKITIDSLFDAPTEAEVAAAKASAEAGRIAVANVGDLWKAGLDAETISRIESYMPRASVPAFQPPSWEAKFQGRTLGYFATAEEAQSRVDMALAEADSDRDAT